MIQSFHIKHFLNHEQFSVQNLPPITVLIGENDTGKTGILKMLYTTAKALEIFTRRNGRTDNLFKKVLAEKMTDVFQPRKSGIGDLVRKPGREKLSAEIGLHRPEKGGFHQDIHFTFGEKTTHSIVDCTEQIGKAPEDFNTLFIPAKEVLTAFKAIKFTRDPHFLLGFDDTYIDLIKALEIPTRKGNLLQDLVKVNKDLEHLFDGSVEQREGDEPFVFKKGNTEFAISMTAEGIKKVGILTTLIRNRQLGKNTVLFFDEPETALHPKAIRQLMEMLVGMSNAGVQIFLSTHNYFVIKQLAICARREKMDILCCSLERGGDGRSIQNKQSNLRDGLPENPIISEALQMFDEDVALDFR